MAELKKGMYVRYPIVTEYVDSKYPRTFALGQIVAIDPIEGTVLLKRYDLLHSKKYYPDAYNTEKALISSVVRATSPESFPIETKDGSGTILQTAYKKDAELFVYYADIPGVGVKLYLESAVHLDYSAFYVDPSTALAMYEFQNPMWFGSRNVVASTMHVLNNAVYGFKELTGCRVFMKPHQITTILRCLQSDEVRFMLADEVGMGKTIEACSIVKIQKARYSQYRVLYIVPRQLKMQWQFELRSKFNLSVIDYSFSALLADDDIIIAAEDLNTSGLDNSAGLFDLVIVDETHKLLNKTAEYNIIKSISQETKGLLLLSATPISSRGEEYLRLLTLLNPKRYQNMTMDHFQALLDQQRDLSGTLFQLFGNMEFYEDFYESVIFDLQTVSENLHDKILDEMIAAIDFETEDRGEEQVLKIIAYICEYYRLEKNVIRNRRNMPGIEAANRKLELISYPIDGNELDFYEDRTYLLLRDWLDELSHSGFENYISIAKECLAAFASSSFALHTMLIKTSKAGVQIPGELMESVVSWKQNESAEIENIRDKLDAPEEITSRLLYIADYLEQEVTFKEKVLVFTQFTETLKAMEVILAKRYRKEEYAVFSKEMTLEELENNANKFQGTPSCRILVCDSTGTEGRNFQMASRIIHIDTPWSVNDIEQRIGRLDRTGRDKSMDVLSVVFQSADTIEEQLISVWKDGIGLYENSISGLEIVSGDIEKRIDSAIITDIHYGLRDALDDIQQLTETMRDGVEEEQFSDVTPNLYSALIKTTAVVLDKYQGKENEIFASSMTAWGSMAGFRPNVIVDDNGYATFRYIAENFSPKASTNAFFIPPRVAKPLIGTFDRAYSIKREELSFYAPGEPVFDSIIRNAITSYRGRTAAFEMTGTPVDFTGLIFIWNISPDMRYMYKQNVDPIMMARFRAFLPLDQIVILIPESDEYSEVTADQIMPLFTDRDAVHHSEHLGRRGSSGDEATPIGQFKVAYPKEYWRKWIKEARQKALAEAENQVKNTWDIDTAREEARRLVNAQNAASRFYGKDYTEDTDVTSMYKAVIEALEHYKITLDAAVYVRLKK